MHYDECLHPLGFGVSLLFSVQPCSVRRKCGCNYFSFIICVSLTNAEGLLPAFCVSACLCLLEIPSSRMAVCVSASAVLGDWAVCMSDGNSFLVLLCFHPKSVRILVTGSKQSSVKCFEQPSEYCPGPLHFTLVHSTCSIHFDLTT